MTSLYRIFHGMTLSCLQDFPCQDVIVFTGFAGNLGGNECACGEMDVCAGGPDHGCNCDSEDGVLRKDRGWLIDKEFLPVRRLCYGFRENTSSDGLINYRVQQFTCGPDEFGKCCISQKIDSSVQDRSNWCVIAMDLMLSWTEPSTDMFLVLLHFVYHPR